MTSDDKNEEKKRRLEITGNALKRRAERLAKLIGLGAPVTIVTEELRMLLEVGLVYSGERMFAGIVRAMDEKWFDLLCERQAESTTEAADALPD